MQRLGVYKKWLSEAELLARNDNLSEHLEQGWLHERANMEQYAHGNNRPFEERLEALGLPRICLPNLVGRALSACLLDLEKATHDIFSHEPASVWEPKLRRYWAYQYWRVRLDHYVQVGATTGGQAGFGTAMASLAGCLCAGWIDEAKLLAEEILVLYQHKRFYDVGGMFGQPLYHWLLRVCLVHWGWGFNDWGDDDDEGAPVALSEPVLNDLVTHWCDTNLTPMQDHVRWLCDYYTHRTKPAGGYEFNNDLLLVRFPAVILAWQRLRQERGLDNPPIDHPLMRPDYARLREPVPMYSDPLLDAVIARLRREEMPDLGGGTQTVGAALR
ncbi:hypothetical protein N5B55_00110 [Ralstonia pickettii]|uniref:hypothetical protein n=1 Tax=Ralstonia pickettii TaxID=329 RepID=UPI00271508AD|nr:hypothetical protein [Ralstonia pickettii]WKZ85395.1 hypothetical protein N5B55_00110 [Ralstonia pickettii]